MFLNGARAGLLESERERGKSGVIPAMGKTEGADLASLRERSGVKFQNYCPNGLTDGQIKKSPDSLPEPGLLNARFAYFE